MSIFGGKRENLTILFKKTSFKSTLGSELFNKGVWTYPHSDFQEEGAVAAGGMMMDKIITYTLLAIIFVNVIFGGASPLLWGMLNTIQIIYFFPLLSLYYPAHLGSFFNYLQVSDMEIDIPIKSEYQDRWNAKFLDWDHLESGKIEN